MSSPHFGVYIHVPWCVTRCPYCSFTTYVEREPPFERWMTGVLEEWRLRAAAFPGSAQSLYFGGGTPSLAPPELIGRIIHAIPHEPGVEITLEANPGTIDEARLRAFRDVGVGRISIGIQTFQPRLARLLDRGHSVGQSQDLLRMVSHIGFESWSIDLMFALPGQQLADLQADLALVCALKPPHVSLYGLTYEPGTPFEKARQAGRLVATRAEGWREQYDRVVSALLGGGWERYELSSFALPGHRGRHNEAIWRGGHYAGLGPGAHGYEPSGRRTQNHTTMEAWLAGLEGVSELPDREQAAMDHVLSTMRYQEGLSLVQLERRTGYTIASEQLNRLVASGNVQHLDQRVVLTEEGFPLADAVARWLCDGLVDCARPE